MFFNLVDARPPRSARSQAFLIHDNWDDWFKFNTLYLLIYVDGDSARHTIGGVKIGEFNMRDDQRRANLDDEFDTLDERFFSLGQDDTYYEKLNELGPDIRDKILAGLQDVALDLNLFDRALKEKVTGVSLLRSVTRATVRGQFHRLAHGGARLSPYEFRYEAPGTSRTRFPPVSLSFGVEPDSQPPTNIHVLIGRNGVGKTHLLNMMTRALAEEGLQTREVGRFVSQADNGEDEGLFANLVSVTFSAFDSFEPLPVRQNKARRDAVQVYRAQARRHDRGREAARCEKPLRADPGIRRKYDRLPDWCAGRPLAPRPADARNRSNLQGCRGHRVARR